MYRFGILCIYFLSPNNSLWAQQEIYNYPGSSNKIGTLCRYFQTQEDFLQNKNADSAVLAINMISEFSFDVQAFLDKPERWEINDLYCIITALDTIYNLKSYGKRPRYSKRFVQDSFQILFLPKENNSMLAYGMLGGALSAAIASGSYSSSMRTKLADHTILAVNKNSGKKIYITKQDLRYNLKSLRDEKIIEAFKAEKEYTLEVILKYFQYFMANKGKLELK
jgi:hypothetical protein